MNCTLGDWGMHIFAPPPAGALFFSFFFFLSHRVFSLTFQGQIILSKDAHGWRTCSAAFCPTDSEYFSSCSMYSLSPPHPEILSHRKSSDFLVAESCIRHKKKRSIIPCGPSPVGSVVQMAVLSFLFRLSTSSAWTLKFQRDELINT